MRGVVANQLDLFHRHADGFRRHLNKDGMRALADISPAWCTITRSISVLPCSSIVAQLCSGAPKLNPTFLAPTPAKPHAAGRVFGGSTGIRCQQLFTCPSSRCAKPLPPIPYRA